MWVIKKLGSVYFAIFLCIFLLLLFILSTSLESLWGTEFAQKIFYQTRWFDLLFSLLWINIFCATLLRFPFQKNHAGFLITHIGILGLLFGALITRLFAVEGQVLLFEKETTNIMRVGGHQWMVTSPDQKYRFFEIGEKSLDIPVYLGKFDQQESFCPLEKNSSSPVPERNLSAGDLPVGMEAQAAETKKETKETLGSFNLSALKIFEKAYRETVFIEGEEGTLQNYALQLHLKSKKMNIDENFWLAEHDPANANSSIQFLGPLRVLLKKEASVSNQAATSPYLRVLASNGEEVASINLDEPVAMEIQSSDKSFRLTNLRYFPHALVENNQLINDSQRASFNPAVEFDLTDSKGNKEHHIHYALFPDFESIHGKSTERNLNVTVRLDVPEQEVMDTYQGPSLIFTVTKAGGLLSHIESQNDSSSKEETVETGKNYPTGWMDIEFSAESFFKHAQTQTQVVEADKKSPAGKTGSYAVQFRIKDKEEEKTSWLMEGEEINLSLSQGDIRLALVERHRSLPFSLVLKDFRKVDYPGTNNPASYESDVLLEDQKDKVKIEKTISMNKPLDYKGYRIFQSSYIQDPNYGEASIFTVAKNPGIPFIYWSSCIIFFGAFMQFFLKNDENGKNGKKKGKST